MKPLYTQEEFERAKVSDKLLCECCQCNKSFYKEKRAINKALKNIDGHTAQFCSASCKTIFNGSTKILNCTNCNTIFKKCFKDFKRSINHFCSQSCAGIYNSQHKTRNGSRRSKLEVYLEEQLTILYPKLEIHFNKREAINSELDIYIPSLKLAFELNGIFHYEPIYGNKKLSQIKNNDGRKFQACIENKIELVLIDVSTQKYFKIETSTKFLNIIIEIINKKL